MKGRNTKEVHRVMDVEQLAIVEQLRQRIKDLELALHDIRAKAEFEQKHPTGLHMTCLSLIQKAAANTLGKAWEPTHQHCKGGLYRKLGEALIERDLVHVVVYEAQDGRWWVRPVDEFNDGRFTRL